MSDEGTVITLDPARGADPDEGRSLAYCDPYNGKVYMMPIMSFVVLQTMRFLADNDQDPGDPDNIADYSGEIAELLSLSGWFTEEEYLADMARSEAEDIDDELKDLLG
jgi:hypothetical protein